MEAQHELLDALRTLLRHVEGINHAFYVEGKPKALRAAMEGQRELLQQARATIAKATA